MIRDFLTFARNFRGAPGTARRAGYTSILWITLLLVAGVVGAFRGFGLPLFLAASCIGINGWMQSLAHAEAAEAIAKEYLMARHAGSGKIANYPDGGFRWSPHDEA